MRTRFIIRRVAILPLQVLGIVSVLFIILQFLPGDPRALILGTNASPAALAQLTQQLGLDKPLPERYINYIGNVFQGDLGQSAFSRAPVLSEVMDRFPATFELVTFGFIIGIGFTIPLGVVSAIRPKSRILRSTTFSYGMAAGALPDFWWGLMLIGVFFVWLGIVPPPLGRLDVAVDPPSTITGMYTVDSLVQGNLAAFWSSLKNLALPGFTLAFVYSSATLKMTRTQVMETMKSDFVRYAQANGLPNRKIYGYALRNALLPVITLSGLAYGSTISGAVLIETLFAWDGLGRYAVTAVTNSDYLAVVGAVMVFATFALTIYILMDILYVFIDPRVGR